MTEALRVIVADPDPQIGGVLIWLLRECGFAADAVGTAEALLQRLDASVPDVVLLDGDAPDMADLVTHIRGDDRFRQVRLIVAVATDSVTAPSPVLPHADDLVAKPYCGPEVVARVRAQTRMRAELMAQHDLLTKTLGELQRARDISTSSSQLADILHDVTGELSPPEIYRVLARRVARALGVSHCSVILAGAANAVGRVVAAFEDPVLRDLEVRLDDYPEIRAALQSERPLLVEESRLHPIFEQTLRLGARQGRESPVRSVITLPFSIDQRPGGVLYIRTNRNERALTAEDVDFAALALRAAVTAIRRALALEVTRADNRRLEALATTDPLTRVLNRRALLDRLSTEVDRARRFTSTLSLLLIDVDYFKLINDTAGHLAGDDVLRQLATLFEEAVRRVDIVARYGGEEFILILPETAQDGGLVFAERLRERVAGREFEVGAERPLHLTVSIGIATFPSARVETTEDLFARADEALYRAKSGGRNLVRN